MKEIISVASLLSSPVDAIVVLVDAPVVARDAAVSAVSAGAAASGESLVGQKPWQFLVISGSFHQGN